MPVWRVLDRVQVRNLILTKIPVFQCQQKKNKTNISHDTMLANFGHDSRFALCIRDTHASSSYGSLAACPTDTAFFFCLFVCLFSDEPQSEFLQVDVAGWERKATFPDSQTPRRPSDFLSSSFCFQKGFPYLVDMQTKMRMMKG